MSQIVAGIDVGGRRKGFHAVALCVGKLLQRYESRSAEDIAAWCRDVNASRIAVDAPCAWSTDGRARPAERMLWSKGIWCFSTPTEVAAMQHPRRYYEWMLAGAEVYKALLPTHPLFDGICTRGPTVFETFPHAVTWVLSGGPVSARNKRRDRGALLAASGVELPAKSSIDTIDAALCALTAHRMALGDFTLHGDQARGYIVTPALPLQSALSCTKPAPRHR
jgi:predicted nuclease with RNAse H fold